MDPNGKTTNTVFDPSGDKASSADPAGDKTQYGYDTALGRVSMTDGTGTSSWTYDIFGMKPTPTTAPTRVNRAGGQHVSALKYFGSGTRCVSPVTVGDLGC